MRPPRWLFRKFVVIAFGCYCSAGLAQVVPSGSTQTKATTASSGQISVNIAMPNASGVSLNQYAMFSVPRAGVGLFNGVAQARTIVNEVVSNNRSYIYGAMTVVGPAAHVLIVNPNGITVDGGSFVNTGGVALSTGSVSFRNSVTSPGLVDTVLTSGAGDIFVTGAGLSGSMTSLQLLAGKIKIDGPIVNTHPDSQANIEVTAGNATAVLDSTVFPGTTLKPWATLVNGQGMSNEILIEVTPNGSLSASRIHMSVSSKGAGVSFAGSGQASIGEFTIAADGGVRISGANIQAEEAVKVTAGNVDIVNSPIAQSQITSISGGVTLLANSGDINISGDVRGVQRDSRDPDSKGGVTLRASGDISLLSKSADRLAIVFSRDDDLYASAGGSINNETGRILSNGRTFINANGDLSNSSGALNAAAPIVLDQTGSRFWWWPFGGHKHTTTYVWNAGDLRIGGDLAYIAGSSVFISAANVTNGGEIDALGGALQIDASRLSNIGSPTGSAYFSRYCAFTCSGKGWSTISVSGGVINATGAMQLNASSRLINDGGVILSEGNMGLNSPSIIAKAIYSPMIGQTPSGLYSGFSGRLGFLSMRPVGGQFFAPVGAISVASSSPVQLGGGGLSAAAEIDNPAGATISSLPPPSISPLSFQSIGVFRGFW
jgi:filamentous hemagglutinin family protein